MLYSSKETMNFLYCSSYYFFLLEVPNGGTDYITETNPEKLPGYFSRGIHVNMVKEVEV